MVSGVGGPARRRRAGVSVNDYLATGSSRVRVQATPDERSPEVRLERAHRAVVAARVVGRSLV